MSDKTLTLIILLALIVILIIALLWLYNSPNFISFCIIVVCVLGLISFFKGENRNNISLDDDVPLNKRHTYFNDLSDEEIEYDYMQREQEKQDEEDYYLQQMNKD